MRRPALLMYPSWVVLITLVFVLGGCEDLSGDEVASTTSLALTTSESSYTTSLGQGSTAASEQNDSGDSETFQPPAPRGAPTIRALDPQQGPEAGGNNVDIFGTGFTPDSEVTFGGIPAHKLHYISSAQLQAQVKGHSPGLVEVVVRTPYGSSSTDGSVNDYTYVRAPEIYAVTPDTCLLGAPVWITITGSGFEGVQSVWFHPDSESISRPAPQWKQVSSTEVRALVPDVDTPGVYEVEVHTSPGGPTRASSDSAADFLFMDPKLFPTLPTFQTIVYP